MMLKVLGSSSKGNCYILETLTGSLLLECGISFKEIQKGLNFDLSRVKGCLVTHEHKDHSKSIKDVMNAGITVWASVGTVEARGIGKYAIDTYWLSFLGSGDQVEIEDFIILPFATEHDAAEPLGFLVFYKPTGEKLLFATDTYYLRYKFVGLNYLLVECNYCEDILEANIEAGKIPLALKDRLQKSHFSLGNAKGFIKAIDCSQLKKIVLIHLSDGNSDARRMKTEIETLTGIDTVVANTGMEIELESNPF